MSSSPSLIELSATELLKLMKGRDISAVDVCESHLAQAEKTRNLNIFVTQTPEIAKANALDSDKRYKNNTALPLDGLPFVHKDLFATQGILTTASSRILSNFIPPYESTVSQKLKDAGIVLMGKSNMDEFAMGSSTLTSYYGPSINPWVSPEDPTIPLVPGGSSGGSTSAVAAFVAVASTGTDTGGSIRQPASYCGLVGLKPTYGRCSRYGIVGFSSSLDQAGIQTRSVKDAALFLEHMADC